MASPLPPATAAPQERELADVAPKAPDKVSPSTMTIAARPATVALVTSGKAPGRKLAFALARGKQSIETSLQIGAEVTTMNRVVMPLMKVGFDVEVTKVDADGTAHLHETITKIEADDTPGQSVPSDKLGDEVQALTGMTIDTTLAPNGQLGAERVVIPSGAEIDQQSLEQLVPQTVMFPPDAVGAGAKWTVTQKGWGDMDATETTTYTLTAMKGAAASLDVDIAITAPRQDVSQGGAKVELTALDGKGTAKLDASTKSPVAGGSSAMSISMTMQSAQKTVTMKMDATAETKIASSP
jgi:hypothetical protein